MQPTTMPTTRRPACKGSECVTGGFRVNVFPSYLVDHSDPSNRQWVFGYRVRITNESPETAQLLSRRWLIVDAHGRENEVRGEGVVGQQPVLRPGKSFEYSSICPMTTRWGTMEGQYALQVGEDERLVEIAVARFYLVGPADI